LAAALERADSLLARHVRNGTERQLRNPSTEAGVLVRAISQATGVAPDEF